MREEHGLAAGVVRACMNCGDPLDDHRCHAKYCGAPCRAAASRARATVTLGSFSADLEAARSKQTAQKRTQNVRAASS